MLSRLSVRDLALVERATVEFGPGLCVLTGETGAGKSLLVAALAALRGGRTSAIPASWGVRFPFLPLHARQAQTTFSHPDVPPRDSGTTWSRLSSRPGNTRPKYWHRFRSRKKMFLLVNRTSRRGRRS